MASYIDRQDLGSGSDEIPLTEASFVRVKDMDILHVVDGRYDVTDIIKLSNSTFLIAVSDGTVTNVSGQGKKKRQWSFSNASFTSVAEMSEGKYLGVDGVCGLVFSFTDDTTTATQMSSRKTEQCYKLRVLDGYQVFSYRYGTIRIKIQKGDCRGRKPSILEENESKDYQFDRDISVVKENDTHVVYVSGIRGDTTNQITKMSMSGEILKVYNDWNFSDAGSIAATGDGHLFVCFPEENCIHLLTPEMDRGITVLDSTDGICKPTAISFCSEQRKLYVANSKHVAVPGFYGGSGKEVIAFDIQ